MQEYWDISIFYNIKRMHSDSNTLLHIVVDVYKNE